MLLPAEPTIPSWSEPELARFLAEHRVELHGFEERGREALSELYPSVAFRSSGEARVVPFPTLRAKLA